MKKSELGKWGEKVACDLLVSKGYAILLTNWRMFHYEIDIIAMTDRYIVFVEVKTRSDDNEDPVMAVDRRKRQHMVASADVFLRHNDFPHEYRFDIVAITGTPQNYTVEHIPDAFFPTLKRH